MTNRRNPVSLPKAYEAAAVEERLYRWWESSGYFKASASTITRIIEPTVMA